MDSFTTQDSTYYSTAPFDWITDSQMWNATQADNLAPGLFIKNDYPVMNQIDQESSLVGLGNIIGKCETVDVQALNKAKELSSGLQRLYDVSAKPPVVADPLAQRFLNNTRLTQPEGSISEKNFNRFQHLPYDPQALSNIIMDNRGGTWSRNEFKDNYICPTTDNRGGNH